MTSRSNTDKQQRKIQMDREILDVDGAAALLGVSKRTIYKLVSDGELPAKKVGKEWRFSKKKLVEWVTQGEPQGNTDSAEALLKNPNIRFGSRS